MQYGRSWFGGQRPANCRAIQYSFRVGWCHYLVELLNFSHEATYCILRIATSRMSHVQQHVVATQSSLCGQQVPPWFDFIRFRYLVYLHIPLLQLEFATSLTYLLPQPSERCSGGPDNYHAAVVVHGQRPSEKVAAPAVARSKLGRLLPLTVTPPFPTPRAVEAPSVDMQAAVLAVVAFVLGAGWRGGAVGAVAVGGRDEAREHVDGAGAGGVVLSSDVVGLGVGRSGRGDVRGPASPEVWSFVKAGGK